MSGGFVASKREGLAILLIAVLTLLVLVALSFGIAFVTQRGVLLASRGALSISLKVVALGYAGLLAATVAHAVARRTGSITFLAANIAILAGLLGVGFFLIRRHVTFEWMIFSTAFVVAVQLGAYSFSWHRRRTVGRLLSSENDRMTAEVARFERHFSDHSYAYGAVPFGAAIGAVLGIVMDLSPRATVRVIAASVSVCLLVFIVIFLFVGARRMAGSYLHPEKVCSAVLTLPKGVAVIKIPSSVGGAAVEDRRGLHCRRCA